MATTKNFQTFNVSAGTTGTTESITAPECLNHTFQMDVTSFTANIVVEAEGSIDGNTFFTLTPDNSATTNFAISNGQATLSAAGTYYITSKNVALNAVRLNFNSGTGTIEAKYQGIRL